MRRVSTAAFRPSLAVRLIMLAAAYAPLLVLLAVLNSFQTSWLRWVFAGVAAASVLLAVLFLLVAVPKRASAPELLTSVKPRDAEALKFFASYVVPFFVTTTAPPEARAGLVVYLVLIGLFYLQADLYYANPLMALLGYRVFDASRPDGGVLILLSRAWHIAPNTVRRVTSLGGYIYLDRGAPAAAEEAQ